MSVINLPNNLTSMFDDIKARIRKLEVLSASSSPTASIMPFAAATAPNGWLLCDGSVYNISAYPTLGGLLLATYGGDGTTTFGVPDLRGRTVAGKDNMGGTTASRITAAVSGITGTTLGASGGQENLHQHTHPNTATFTGTAVTSGDDSPDHAHGTPFVNALTEASSKLLAGASGTAGIFLNRPIVTGSTNTGGASARHQHSVTAAGTVAVTNNNNAQTGTAQNVQPTLILNYIIRAS